MRALALALALAALPACRARAAPILLFNGDGTSPGDVRAIEDLLDDSGLGYETADSLELDLTSAARLRAHRLLLVPGGNFLTMGAHLRARTVADVHDAVRAGLAYFGICAGAFLAGYSPAYKSFDLTGGVHFNFYSAEDHGVRKAALAIAGADGARLDQYWEDGPQLGGWGAVVGRYPDGTPAIVEGAAGRGWVVLSGVHPEAPASWRRGLSFATPVSADRAYALALIRAALERAPLPHE